MKPTTNPRLTTALGRLARRHRRALAALCTFLAVLGALSVLTPPAPPMRDVVVATDALPAGTTLTASHVTVRPLPTDAVPDEASTSPDELVGRTLTSPVSRGTVLTGASIATGSRLAQPGHVVVAVPLPNPALADLASPGTHLDLWDAEGALIATDVRVVAGPEAERDGFTGASSGATLLEVTPEVATRLATLRGGDLTIAVR